MRLLLARNYQVTEIQNYLAAKFQLSESEKEEISNASIAKILHNYETKKWTPIQVFQVFLERSAKIGIDLGAVAYFNLAESLHIAEELTQKIKEQTSNPEEFKKLGRLCGIPIRGVLDLAEKPYDYDSTLLKILKNEGAIPFVRGNMPQFGLLPECKSFWGLAKNPYNKNRSPGGSSGGDAILVATKCAVIGFGTDIGGSLRLPGLFCGIPTIRCTVNRNSKCSAFNYGKQIIERGQINIETVYGPLTKSVDDLQYVLEILINHQILQEDEALPPVCWNKQLINKRNLNIGFVKENEYCAIPQCCLRALQTAVQILETKGNRLKEFKIPSLGKAIQIYAAISTAEGGMKSLLNCIKDEPPLKEYKLMLQVSQLPWFLRTTLVKFLYLIKEKRLGDLTAIGGQKTVLEYFSWSSKQFEYRNQFIHEWKKAEIDVLLTCQQTPAFKHGGSRQSTLPAISMQMLFNLIDFPSGVVPITTVRQDEQQYIDPNYKDTIAEAIRNQLKDSQGLPIGVQVSAFPYQDELCINVMKQISSEIQFQMPQLQ